MNDQILRSLSSVSAVLVMASALACSQPSAPPTSPAAGASGTGAAADGSTLKVTSPIPVSPVGGVEITDLDPDLVITNAQGKFVSLPLAYVFEVTDESGQVVYRSAEIPAGANGRTTHEIAKDLKDDETHTWKAYAVYQGQRGPASSTASFKTFNRFGTICRGSEAQIVACRKAQYGHIPHSKLPEFLERVAYDLNVNGHEWAPYGRLIKDIGNNCQGYSCDIICSDTGMHRQWDVLIDEDSLQGPVWNRVAEVAVRPCEIPR